jgi:hypothetical protein
MAWCILPAVAIFLTCALSIKPPISSLVNYFNEQSCGNNGDNPLNKIK